MSVKWDLRFMELAKLVSTWSKDPSTQVGAVAVDSRNVIMSTGYNGFPRGVYDSDENLNNREEKYPRVIHSELNCCLFINRMGMIPPFRIYVYPFAPCAGCMGAIIQAGITEVITFEASDELKERWGKSNEIADEMAFQAGVKIRRLVI